MTPAATTGTLLSMTGYAQARAEQNGWRMRVSLRSVNHRFLDLRVRIPEGFESLEPRIRELLRAGLRRGHVEVTLHVEAAAASGVQINREAAGAYLRAVETMRGEFGLTQEPDVIALLRLPGVVTSNGTPGPAADEEEIARLDEPLAACLREAMQKLE